MQKSKLQFKNQKWEMLSVDHFFEKLSVPKQYEKREVLEKGKVPVIDQSADGIYGYHNNKPDFYASPKNPLITFANHTCHVRFITFNFSVIQNVFPLRVKNDVDPKFFYFSLLNKITPEGYKGHWPKFKELILPKPPPEIQKRIVARIEELFEKIDKAKGLREKAKEETEQIFPSALQEIFTKAEKKWGTRKLGEILVKKPQYGLTAKSSKEKKNFRYIRITDITDKGELRSEDPKYVDLDGKEFNKYKLEREDFLIARTGSVGRVYLHRNTERPCVFASYLIRFKLNQAQALPRFIFYFGFSPKYKKKIEDTLRIMTQPNINAQEFSKFEIPLPPLSEQKKIVAYLDNLREKVDKLEKLQEEQLKDLEKLKKSILEKAFSGELVK